MCRKDDGFLTEAPSRLGKHVTWQYHMSSFEGHRSVILRPTALTRVPNSLSNTTVCWILCQNYNATRDDIALSFLRPSTLCFRHEYSSINPLISWGVEKRKSFKHVVHRSPEGPDVHQKRRARDAATDHHLYPSCDQRSQIVPNLPPSHGHNERGYTTPYL